jgi:hypothetical protein
MHLAEEEPDTFQSLEPTIGFQGRVLGHVAADGRLSNAKPFQLLKIGRLRYLAEDGKMK